MLFAEASRRKAVSNKTLEVRQIALLHFVERAVTFRASNRDLIAGRFTCRTIGSCLILHTSSSIWRFCDVGGRPVCQLNEYVSNLTNWQTKTDIDHADRILRHVWRESFGRILNNRHAAARFDGKKTRRSIIVRAAEHHANNPGTMNARSAAK